MQLQFLLFLATASFAVAAPSSGNDIEVIEVPAALVSRACVANGCRCKTGIKAGIYCGACVVSTSSYSGWAITKKFNQNHIFQCGSNGSCCDYGTATECGPAKGRCAQGRTP